jgi:hypothetical protein
MNLFCGAGILTPTVKGMMLMGQTLRRTQSYLEPGNQRYAT